MTVIQSIHRRKEPASAPVPVSSKKRAPEPARAGASSPLAPSSGKRKRVKRKGVDAVAYEELVALASAHDIYRLFELDKSATAAEIAQKRRQLTQKMHPDNFTDRPEEQEHATVLLQRINQAFANVLRDKATRALYDELCTLRQLYALFGTEELSRSAARTAAERLRNLSTSIKATIMPAELASEAHLAAKILDKLAAN